MTRQETGLATAIELGEIPGVLDLKMQRQYSRPLPHAFQKMGRATSK